MKAAFRISLVFWLLIFVAAYLAGNVVTFILVVTAFIALVCITVFFWLLGRAMWWTVMRALGVRGRNA